MSIDKLKNLLPDFAKDIKLNLSSLANDESLTDQQKWGAFFASALATRHATTITYIEAAAADYLSAEAMEAAKAAHAIMAMNNIYYRFLGLVKNDVYQTMPAGLRMNVIANPGVEKADFELWALAVSSINACKGCINAHENELLKHDITTQQIQTAVRISSVVHAVAAIIDGEQAMQGDLQQAA